MNNMKFAARLAGAIGLAVVLGMPEAGLAQSQNPAGVYVSNRTVTGVVQNVNRKLNYVTIMPLDTGRPVKIDVRRMDTRQSVNVWRLRPGDRVTANGAWENRDTFQADFVNTYGTDVRPMTSASAANLMNGIVQRVNRRLNYITVRDAQTGQVVKVDVRGMDTHHSINVWQLRPGDRIVVDGGWENRETFQASRVNF